MSLVLQAGQRVRIQPVYLLQTGHLIALPRYNFSDKLSIAAEEIRGRDSSIMPTVAMMVLERRGSAASRAVRLRLTESRF